MYNCEREATTVSRGETCSLVMAQRVEARVEPSLLVWARQSAGFTTETVAKRAGVKTERLESWEQGESRPTINQLRNLAEIYKRPLAVFYLSEPPKDFKVLRDYRRLSGAVAPEESPELRREIRRALYRREVALDLAEDGEDAPPRLEASASLSDDPERVGACIRSLLDVSLEEQVGWETEWVALSNWRLALQEAGALVFQASGVEIKEMRGFSLTERPLPVIVVNARDLPRGRVFSLIHELTHILLHDNGLCDLSDWERRSPDLQRVERFCNSVAAATLVPKDDLLAQPLTASKSNRTSWSWDEIRELSSRYEVSDQALLGRLHTLGKVEERFYWRTMRVFQRQGQKSKPRSSGGPPPPQRVFSSAGRLFTQIVLDGYYDERITATDLSDYLEVKLKHIPKIEELVRENSTARRMLY